MRQYGVRSLSSLATSSGKGKQPLAALSRNFGGPATLGACEQDCLGIGDQLRHSSSTINAYDNASGSASSSSFRGIAAATSSNSHIHHHSARQQSSSQSTSTHTRSALVRPIRLVPPKSLFNEPSTTPLRRLRERRKGAPPSGGNPTLPAPSQREREIARLYALRSPPSIAALSALAERISPALLGSRSGKDNDKMLAMLEQCCTCRSFWTEVDEYEKRNLIVKEMRASADRTNDIPAAPAAATPQRYTHHLDATRAHNEAFATLGNHLLGVFAVEWLEARYPHLPERVLKAALTLYVGPRTCVDIATKQWGLTSGQAARQAYLAEHAGIGLTHRPGTPTRGVGEGGRGGAGLLRWGKQDSFDALLQRVRKLDTSADNDNASRTPLPLEEALTSATKAVVGLIFQEHGFAASRKFVHSVFLSRQADIAGLLKFPVPKYTLSATLAKYKRERPVSRLIAETGRLSIAPVFVTGVYSGSTKLGEGYGSSIAMSEYRAAEDALRRIYLSPSAEDPLAASFGTTIGAKKQQYDAEHELELPTDTLVYPGRRLSKTTRIPDDEIIWQSSGRSSFKRT